MEDACDMELLKKSLIDLMVHGTLLAGKLGNPSPGLLPLFGSNPSSLQHVRVRLLLRIRRLRVRPLRYTLLGTPQDTSSPGTPR